MELLLLAQDLSRFGGIRGPNFQTRFPPSPESGIPIPEFPDRPDAFLL